MSGPRSIPELPEISAIQEDDLIVVEQIAENSSETTKTKFSTIRSELTRGPFIDDAQAATALVGIGHMYYTPTGEVKVRVV